MEEKETMHWADKHAEEIITKKPGKKEYVVESGITPSGTVHAGNFREVITQDLVHRALIDKGVKSKYQYFWDDYDRFRKVPKGVDAKWENYIGMPVCKVPDPHGCHKSYAEHYEAPLLEENKMLGVNCEYLHGSQEYAKGIFADLIKTALEKKDDILTIINKYRKEPRSEEWLPVEVYCEQCEKDTTKAKYNGGYSVSYSCECGQAGDYDFRKTNNVKLRWRIDWPMRWKHYDVDFESAGKEHHASGGSWDTGVEICKEVFSHEPPIGPMYEFIYFKGQTEKMSKSVGNVVTIRKLLDLYEPEVLRYIYSPRINRSFNISFDADLLNNYNYYDEAEKMAFGLTEKNENEVRKWQLSQIGKIPKKPSEKPQFSVCVNDIQIALGDVKKAKEILEKTGHPAKNAEQRLLLAWNWVQHHAPEQYVFRVQENLDKIRGEIRLGTWDETITKLLGDTADYVAQGRSGEDVQQFIFNACKDRQIPMQTAFTAFYQLILCKSRGPKLGPFLTSLDTNFVVKRLKLKG